MRVEWDENRCAVSALCAGLVSDVFRVDEGGRLTVGTGIDEPQREAIRDAADSCPTRAITVAD
jgi:ferredoxin